MNYCSCSTVLSSTDTLQGASTLILEPPLDFRDEPVPFRKVHDFCNSLAGNIISNALSECRVNLVKCSVPQRVLDFNRSLSEEISDTELEFSNSPKFSKFQHCFEEAQEEPTTDINTKHISLLSDNSNCYKSFCISNHSVPGSSRCNEVTKLPLKKRKLAYLNYYEEVMKKEALQEEVSYPSTPMVSIAELSMKKKVCYPARPMRNTAAEEEKTKQEEAISYPATPMISTAELEALHLESANLNFNANIHSRLKTLAERKEMPPLPVYYNDPIITDRFNINNHTYNNPTINYHMNNGPVPFINIPCGTSYYSIPPILLPFNNVSYFNDNKTLQTDMKQERKKTTRARRSKP